MKKHFGAVSICAVMIWAATVQGSLRYLKDADELGRISHVEEGSHNWIQKDLPVHDLIREDRDGDDGGDDDDDSGDKKVEIKFSPKEYGIEPGYYCSVSTLIADTRYRYSFDNCSCGVLATCNDDWGTFDMQFLGGVHSFNVGQCQPKAWIITILSILCLGFFLLVGRVLYRVICVRRTRYTVTETVEERLLPSTSGSENQGTNQIVVERTRTTTTRSIK